MKAYLTILVIIGVLDQVRTLDICGFQVEVWQHVADDYVHCTGEPLQVIT